MTQLPLQKIRLDGGTQPRDQLNQDKITEYVQAMLNGDVFPPIEIIHDGQNYWPWDGYHRIEARRIATGKNSTIAANINQGSQRDAILLSTGANANHGLPRTNDDKRRAVLRLLTDPEWSQWSDREIARRTKTSPTYVGNLRPTVNVYSHQDHQADPAEPVQTQQTRTYTTPTGTTATMNTTNIGRKPIMPDQMLPHVEAFIQTWPGDHHGQTFAQIENPSHTNGTFWRDLTNHFDRNNIPYAQAGLKFTIKQLHAQSQQPPAVPQETTHPDPDLVNECLQTWQAWLKNQPGDKQQHLDQMLRHVSDWDPHKKYTMSILNQARDILQAQLNQSTTQQPTYTPIHALETHIRQWLIHRCNGGNTLIVHLNLMDNLKRGNKQGTEFKLLTQWLNDHQISHRINDLWQACQNTHDQLTQQKHQRQQTGQSLAAAQTQPPPNQTAESESIDSPAPETEEEAPPSPSATQFMYQRDQADRAQTAQAAQPLAAKIAASQNHDPRLDHALEIIALSAENWGTNPRIAQIRAILGAIEKLVEQADPDSSVIEHHLVLTLSRARSNLEAAIAVLKKG